MGSALLPNVFFLLVVRQRKCTGVLLSRESQSACRKMAGRRRRNASKMYRMRGKIRKLKRELEAIVASDDPQVLATPGFVNTKKQWASSIDAYNELRASRLDETMSGKMNALLKAREQDGSVKKCCIAYCDHRALVVLPACSHATCFGCFYTLRGQLGDGCSSSRNKCPICRASTDPDDFSSLTKEYTEMSLGGNVTRFMMPAPATQAAAARPPSRRGVRILQRPAWVPVGTPEVANWLPGQTVPMLETDDFLLDYRLP